MVPPGRDSAFRAAFWPDSSRENLNIGLPAGGNLAGGPILMSFRLESGRNLGPDATVRSIESMRELPNSSEGAVFTDGFTSQVEPVRGACPGRTGPRPGPRARGPAGAGPRLALQGTVSLHPELFGRSLRASLMPTY